MSPRPGGEADKIGNRYEAAWATRHALYCVANDGHSLVLEDSDPEIGKGSEFTYRTKNSTEVHQLKRQNGNYNGWTVKSLADLNVFEAASSHIRGGRDFHFVSQVACRPLQELADRARRSSGLTQFTQAWLTAELRQVFDQLTAEQILGSAQVAWETLRGMWFSVQDERELNRTNALLAGSHLSGATGELIVSAIGKILVNSLGKRLTRTDLLSALAKRGISPIGTAARKNARELVARTTQSWRDSIRRELIDPRIERTEASAVLRELEVNSTVFVSGSAGGGKSSVLEQSVELLEATGAVVLAIRLDRHDSLASTSDLGRRLGFEDSPTTSLAMTADGQDAYLVIDQLDAVSLASGRLSDSFDVVVDLIGEALSVPRTKVILACRAFDIENDQRIRSLTYQKDTATVSVGFLSETVVDVALAGMGIDSKALNPSQKSILQTPLHLGLLQSIVGQEGALTFHSKGSLFETYWDRKRQASRKRRSSVRFNDVVSRVANEASSRQTLSIPVELLDEDDLIDDANVLVSEHILARDNGRIAFFHESFFDYAFARQWVSQSGPLVDFLLGDEQELFRRAQVRQILQHLYELDRDRFRSEVLAVLAHDQVRYHIKQTALSVLSTLSAPDSADAEAILHFVANDLGISDQVWSHICRPAWFARFHEDGYVDSWLDSGDIQLRERALNLMVSGTEKYPSGVAQILRARRAVPQFREWVRRIAGRAELHQSREMFDELLVAIGKGTFDDAVGELWLSVYDLAKYEPLWAVEVLRARITDHPQALRTSSNGRVTLLEQRDHTVSSLVREAAVSEPVVFAQTVVPYLMRVMAATAIETPTGALTRDEHFWHRLEPSDSRDRDLGDTLFSGAILALEGAATAEPNAIQPLLDNLATDAHDATQFLLYRALVSGASNFANWAASLLLSGGTRLVCGYITDSRFVTRELLSAVAPLVNDELHHQLELSVRDLRNSNEARGGTGRLAFILLSALEESRLSPTGVRRLAEYRRKFNETTPDKSQSVFLRPIDPPISADAAAKVSDDQWLRAMMKYDTNEKDVEWSTHRAYDLSAEFRSRVATDPIRFARFALRLTCEHNVAHPSALLLGLGDAEYIAESAPLVFDAVRHIASLGHEETDRWIGYALQKYLRDVPLDLVELILHRALSSSDPQDDAPRFAIDGSEGMSAVDMWQNSINTVRGSLVETLGGLLDHDVDGKRTSLVRPHLNALASEPVVFVRSSVARIVKASLRHAREDAVVAFLRLVDSDDRILATSYVRLLMINIGNVRPSVVEPIIARMLSSMYAEVREKGGGLAAFAAIEWGLEGLAERAMAGDMAIRKGAAEVCAEDIVQRSNGELTNAILSTLMYDGEVEVRKSVAKLAVSLRDQRIQPFTELLRVLIDSPAYEYASSELLITLQCAPDKVDELVLLAAHRFLAVFGSVAGDIRTGAAGDAHYMCQLVVRGLAQSRDKEHRGALLDVLDNMFELGIYGISGAVATAERQ